MIEAENAFKQSICTRGDSGIWAYQEKLLQKFHQRALLVRFPRFSLPAPKWMKYKPERLPKVFQKSLLNLGNGGQVRLPCLETVLLKAISIGWGFLRDCGTHVDETYLWIPQCGEGHQAAELNVPPVAEAFWGAEGLLHLCAAQRAGPTAEQDVLTCGKCSWRQSIEISSAAPLEIFTKQKGLNQRKAVCMWQPKSTYKFQRCQAFWHNPHTQSPKLASC